MKTIRRDQLRKLAEAGKLEMVSSYHYDDMGGESRSGTMPVRFSTGYEDFVEGFCNLRAHDFTSSSGTAYFRDNDEQTICLHVHGNCS